MKTIKTIMTVFAGSILALTMQTAGAAEYAADSESTALPEATEYTWTVGAAAESFVQESFTFTISPQVMFAAKEDASGAAVGAGSVRGKYVFTGTTEGGSVKDCGVKQEDGVASGSVLTSVGVGEENGCLTPAS